MEFVLITIAIIIFTCELSTFITVGPPWITMSKEYLLEQVAESRLNQFNPSILSTPDGMISTCGTGITGTLYYFDSHRSHAATRIPWWTPLYREVRKKRAELLSKKASV